MFDLLKISSIDWDMKESMCSQQPRQTFVWVLNYDFLLDENPKYACLNVHAMFGMPQRKEFNQILRERMCSQIRMITSKLIVTHI